MKHNRNRRCARPPQLSHRVHCRVDPYVQSSIRITNGNLYGPLVDRLSRYPIPAWPAAPGSQDAGLLLDIGCGWGRWMVAAGRAGYKPVGVDIELEAVQAARRVMAEHGVIGLVVVADLAALPFKSAAFDFVFSYSAIQHVDRRTASDCIVEIARVLRANSACLVELPLKPGLTNWRHSWRKCGKQDPDPWAVRYYSWRELGKLFRPFGGLRIRADSFGGINVQRDDFDLLPWKYKPVVVVSEILKICSRLFPPLARLSDSVFIEARKGSDERRQQHPPPATAARAPAPDERSR
jgi:SAM-dependent methyltransferase